MSEKKVKKDDLVDAAIAVDDAAVDTALDGLDEVDAGLDALEIAGDVAAVAGAEAMAAASDLTRAVDAEVVADRLGTLADVVGAAGVTDVAEGAELLMASEDVGAMGAAVGLMSLGDLDRGLELSRIAGELQTLSDVVDTLEMPVLSAVLNDRGLLLQEISVDVILRAAAERSLSALMEATGLKSGPGSGIQFLIRRLKHNGVPIGAGTDTLVSIEGVIGSNYNDGLAVVAYHHNVSPSPFNMQSVNATVRSDAKAYIDDVLDFVDDVVDAVRSGELKHALALSALSRVFELWPLPYLHRDEAPRRG